MESSTSEVVLLKTTIAQLMRTIEDLMKERNDFSNQIKETLIIKKQNEDLQKENIQLKQNLGKAQDESNRLQSEIDSQRDHLGKLLMSANVFRRKFDELTEISEDIKKRSMALESENKQLKGKLKEASDNAMAFGGILANCADKLRKMSTSLDQNPNQIESTSSPSDLSTLDSLPTEDRVRLALPNGDSLRGSSVVDFPTHKEVWKCTFCELSGFSSEDAFLKHVELCQ